MVEPEIYTFNLGQEAVVHGLTSEAGQKLNGEQVVILKVLNAQGRHCCLFASNPEQPENSIQELKSIKLENLAPTFRGTTPVMQVSMIPLVLKAAAQGRI